MARKKTRKQKKMTSARKVDVAGGGLTGVSIPLAYSIDDSVLRKRSGGKLKPSEKISDSQVNLFDYDPSLLTGDITRTLMISGVIFAMLIGLFLYLR